MNIKLNVLNDNMLLNPEHPVNLEEKEFWIFYFSFLRIKGINITDKEIEVLALICCTDPYKPHFNTQDKNNIIEHMNISEVRFYAIRKSLLKKKLIGTTDDGKYLILHPQIRKFQVFVKKHINEKNLIEFVFPFKVDLHGTVAETS